MSSNNGGGRSEATRRQMIKLASGAGASALVVPGLAAGDSGNETGSQSRKEKAEKEGKEWSEDWIDADEIGETEADLETQLSAQDGRITDEIVLNGINVTIEIYIGDCEGWVEVTALGRTERITLTCADPCEEIYIDAGAAYLDLQGCYDWDTQTLSLTAEACILDVTEWVCVTFDEDYQL